MPTPSDTTHQTVDPHHDRLAHTTCPPEHERPEAWRAQSDDIMRSDDIVTVLPPHAQDSSTLDGPTSGPAEHHKTSNMEQDQSSQDTSSPMSISTDAKEGDLEQDSAHSQQTDTSTPSTSSTNYHFSNIRMFPNHTSSFLRAGSKFRGTQQSDRQVYKVEVDIKHVDMAESFLCGYLRIEGLTEDHPSLTTYFESEIIGPKYTFQTKHPSWGATDKTDMQHWARFPSWRPLAKQAKKPDFHYKNFTQRESIFMRWKEYFLVPDHRVREIMGASFEGFYYICFNQVAGTVSGIYFHAKSEKYDFLSFVAVISTFYHLQITFYHGSWRAMTPDFPVTNANTPPCIRFQQLELSHVDDQGCLGAIEFR